MQFKDLFSNQSTDYAKFRPTYPPELFSYLASLVPEKKTVWDCGTGNGQAALSWTEYFDQVMATDPSEKQIQSAAPHPKIKYSVASAEDSHLPSQSVNLVSVAQAFHWFDQNRFLHEAQRVAQPGAILAIWCYQMAQVSPEVDREVWFLYENILGPYWDPERKMVEEGYRNVQLPLQEISTPPFELKAQWQFEHLIGYLGTWSALQKFITQNQRNPLEESFEKLRAAWGSVTAREVRWQMGLRVWRL